MTTTKKEATKTSPKKPRTVKVASLELPKQPLVFEVLDLASKQRSKAKKVEVILETARAVTRPTKTKRRHTLFW